MIPKVTALKIRKLDFESRSLQLKYTSITTIMDELALNQVIHKQTCLSFKCQRKSDEMGGWEIS